MDYLVYIDGFCKGNGKRDAEAGGSFAVYKLGHDDKIGDKLHARLAMRTPLYHDREFTVVVPDRDHATNNFAEATSLRTAISWLIASGLLVQGNTIHICMDSQLVLNQVTGMYRTNKLHLRACLETSAFIFTRRHVDKKRLCAAAKTREDCQTIPQRSDGQRMGACTSSPAPCFWRRSEAQNRPA